MNQCENIFFVLNLFNNLNEVCSAWKILTANDFKTNKKLSNTLFLHYSTYSMTQPWFENHSTLVSL